MQKAATRAKQKRDEIRELRARFNAVLDDAISRRRRGLGGLSRAVRRSADVVAPLAVIAALTGTTPVILRTEAQRGVLPHSRIRGRYVARLGDAAALLAEGYRFGSTAAELARLLRR